jgi:F1F0 ATPase subunit 2
MNNLIPMFMSALAGVMLGAFFFGGLWMTVKKGLTSPQPVRWFCLSTLLRTGTALVGFYFVSSGDWQKLLACLVGFFIARIVVTRMVRNAEGGSNAP